MISRSKKSALRLLDAVPPTRIRPSSSTTSILPGALVSSCDIDDDAIGIVVGTTSYSAYVMWGVSPLPEHVIVERKIKRTLCNEIFNIKSTQVQYISSALRIAIESQIPRIGSCSVECTIDNFSSICDVIVCYALDSSQHCLRTALYKIHTIIRGISAT